jgi:hypothetical protein
VDPEGLRSFIRRVDRALTDGESDAAYLDALMQVAGALEHRLSDEAAELTAAVDRALDDDGGAVAKLTRERRTSERQLEVIRSRRRALDALATEPRPNRR